jgi:methyl-accepting chemotaxis protein
MFGLFKRKTKGEVDCENISTPEDFDRYIKENPSEVTNIFKNIKFFKNFVANNTDKVREILNRHAHSGNIGCIKMLIAFSKAIETNAVDPEIKKHSLREIIKFGEMAANHGDLDEIIDLPKAQGKLASIIIEQNENNYCEESVQLLKSAYELHSKNKSDQRLSQMARKEAEEQAANLEEVVSDIDSP